MEELIPIKSENNRQLVSARALHKGLGLKKKFGNWWKESSTSFEENTDFTREPKGYLVQSGNGTVRKYDDYLLTLDMAKELCMMSKTEKGKQIRKYFIKAEEAWNSPDMVMHRALVMSNEKIKKLQDDNKVLSLQLKESNKKASYLDVILGTPDALVITQIAFDYGYSASAFNKLLHRVGIQHKVNGQWILYTVYMGKGYTTTKHGVYKDHQGRHHSKPYTAWTQKGRKLIYDVLKDEGILPLIERDDIA